MDLWNSRPSVTIFHMKATFRVSMSKWKQTSILSIKYLLTEYWVHGLSTLWFTVMQTDPLYKFTISATFLQINSTRKCTTNEFCWRRRKRNDDYINTPSPSLFQGQGGMSLYIASMRELHVLRLNHSTKPSERTHIRRLFSTQECSTQAKIHFPNFEVASSNCASRGKLVSTSKISRKYCRLEKCSFSKGSCKVHFPDGYYSAINGRDVVPCLTTEILVSQSFR
jgi:hypothetical protein